jgi:type II secretory pathway component GspD/PulD (secretin)
MKSKMLIATLLGCLVWQQGVFSQTDTTATNPPTAPAVATNESPSAATSNESPAASAVTPPAESAAATNEPPPATPPAAPTTTVTETTTTTTPPVTPAAAATETPAAATPPAVPATTVTETTTTTTPPVAPAAGATETPAAATPPAVPATTVTETTTTTTPPVAPAAAATETPAAATPPAVPATTVTETTTTTTPPVTPAAAATETPAVATPPAAPATTVTETTTTTTPPVAPAAAATETPAAATPPAAPATTVTETTTTTTQPVAPAASSNETVGATAATPPAVPAAITNESPVAVTSNAQVSVSASIPLIQFQDVPITTAIENLTRQAGINYLLDPKIGYGQPDANGQVKPEPTLSIRWENITAAQALLALLDNYGLQLVEDRRTHIARITTKDPTAPPPLSTRVVQIKYAGASNLVESIQTSFTDKRSKVLPDVRTSQLVVVATENEQEAVELLINQLDKPTRQVLIETKLVEISSNPSTTKGVDWSGTLQAQHVTFGNGFASGSTATTMPGKPGAGTTTPGSTTTITTPGTSISLPTTTTITIPSTTTPGPTPKYSGSTTLNTSGEGSGGFNWNTFSGLSPAIGFLSADGASAVLSFMNSTYDAQVVSTPRVVTLDNQMATIEVTRGYPVINMSGGTQNSSGSSSVTYSNVGTILQVTPRISANDCIWLRVVPVVSSHFGDEIVTVQGGSGNASTSYAVPIFDSRRIDSQVMIPDGNTLVMGGLIQDNPTASYNKVPLLGDIPGLGWAFRSESKSMIKDNLIIFLTPTIIKNSDFQPVTSVATDFLQSKPSVMKNRMNPKTIWDGAEPHGDWSNPAPVPGEFNGK